MRNLIWIHFCLLLIALFISFALVPIDRVYFKNISTIEIIEYYENAFALKSGEAWQTAFTWFLGLACGRIMVKALMSKEN